jgi:hypothetical protein
LDNPLYLLRLKSAELIFSSEPPVVIAAHEIDEPYSNIIETDPVSNPAQPINKQVKAKSVAVLKQSQQDENPKPIVLRSIQQDTAHDLSALPDLQVSELTQSIQDSQGTNNMNTISPNVDQQLMPSECSNIIPSSYETVEPENTIASQIQSTCEPVDNSKCWLENQGDAGQWLIDIASMLNQGQWHLDRDILYVQDKYLLPFPATAEKLNIDPPQFIKTLEGNGWLVTDVMSPMRKVQIIQSVRGVLLALEPSLALNALLKFRDNSLLTASSAQTPSSNKDKTRDEFKSSQAQKETGGEPKPKRSKSNSTGKQNLITDKASDSSVNSQSDKTNNLLPLPPVKSGTIDLLITYVRQQNIPSDESSPDNNWHTVSNIELEQFLTQHSTIKRTRLMIDIANHPDCRSVSATEGIQVRLHP